ncbi:MAG: hypothetical protein KDB80_12785 [Planctomycetes bacterium]|nr:hypothetical protein [Planctomycetota bacterium]
MIKRPGAIVCGIGAIVTAIVYLSWTTEGVREPRTPTEQADARSRILAQARRAFDLDTLDAFIAEQRTRIQTDPDRAEDWRILAEAHLERAWIHGRNRGMEVGRPTWSKLPEPVQQDLDLGEAALQRARELGDATSESYRIEAALTTARVTGVATAVRLDSRVRTALDTATRLDPHNPDAIVAAACRKLFKPAWLGGDPTEAKADLLAVANVVQDDERPLMFAAYAAWLLEQKDEALALMRRCHARNPANHYAEVVVRRLEAGEDDPFGRDVD